MKKINQLEIEMKETKTTIEDQGKIIEDLKETKEKQSIIIEDLKEAKKEQNIIIGKQNKTINDQNKQIGKLERYNEKLGNIISKSQFDITEIKFTLKMISLRGVYKSFFDVLIYIFELKEKNNIESKYIQVVEYLKNKKGKEIRELKMLLNNIFEFLKSGNYEAHNIDLSKSLVSQLVALVKKYKFKDYPKLVEFLEKTSFESRLKELVELRAEKFIMKREYYQDKENIIINNIKNDKELKKKFLDLSL